MIAEMGLKVKNVLGRRRPAARGRAAFRVCRGRCVAKRRTGTGRLARPVPEW